MPCVKSLLLLLINAYQLLLSPFLGANCRFSPTCSQYAVDCLDHYPIWKALPKIVIRIGKCHPFHPGGFDPAVPKEPEVDPHQSCKRY